MINTMKYIASNPDRDDLMELFITLATRFPASVEEIVAKHCALKHTIKFDAPMPITMENCWLTEPWESLHDRIVKMYEDAAKVHGSCFVRAIKELRDATCNIDGNKVSLKTAKDFVEANYGR